MTKSPIDELLESGYRYAYSLTHHREDAEDLLQCAVIRLHRKYGELGPRSRLFVTLRNLFFDQLRRKNVATFESLESQPEATCSLDPVGIAAASAGADLEVMLAKLDPADRELLYLHYAEGYSASEIGRLTGMPRGTVLSRIHRTMKQLKKSNADSESTN